MYSFQLSRHSSAKWRIVASYVPDAVVPAPHLDLSRSKVHIFLDWLKGLGEWVRARNLVGDFHRQWGCTRIQRKKELFKQVTQVTKMVT
jgi:hypothetical protein